jgi:hypothetical protein
VKMNEGKYVLVYASRKEEIYRRPDGMRIRQELPTPQRRSRRERRLERKWQRRY